MLKNVTIEGKEYKALNPNDMNRVQIKGLKKIMYNQDDMESLWDLLALVVPGLPAKVRDNLTVTEVNAALAEAGILDATEQGELSLGE